MSTDTAASAATAAEQAPAAQQIIEAEAERPETPAHDEDNRLGESQAELEIEEDPRL